MATFSIAATNLAANSQLQQTFSVPVGVTRAQLSVARNQTPNPIDGLPSGTNALEIDIEQSQDNGVSYLSPPDSATFGGGVVNDKAGSEILNSWLTIDCPNPTNTQRMVRVTVKTFTNPVSVSGTVTLS